MHLGLSSAQWLVSGSIFGLLLLVGSQDPVRLYAASKPDPVAIPLFTITHVNRSTRDEDLPVPVLSANAVYALSLENGEVLFEHNGDVGYAPASTTKLLTALVVRQRIALDQLVSIPRVFFVDARQPLRAGQIYTVEELLAALLIGSNNTAAYALAQAHPQGLEGFMDDMRATARTIGLQNSVFTNPAGFDDPRNRSTTHDLVQLFRAALQDPLLAQLLGTTERPLSRPDGEMVAMLRNTHQLLGSDIRVKAGKTGTTDEARQVLISLVETHNHPYIVVLLGSADRYAETRHLADWIDSQYTWQSVEPSALIQQLEQAQRQVSEY